MKESSTSIKMATADWFHEIKLSLCSVFALASILAPMLVLHGIHCGIISNMKDNLMTDPNVLIIMPTSVESAGYNEAFFDKVRAQKGTQFCIGRTRDVASELQVVAANGDTLVLTLEPTATGDPLLARYGVTAELNDVPGRTDVVVTTPVARKLGIKVGDMVTSTLMRRTVTGGLEQQTLYLYIASILKPQASGADTMLVPLSLLTDIQDFRDNIPVVRRGWSGINPAPTDRRYESFRVYAKDLDSVESLDRWFREQQIVAKTRVREIANIRNLDQSLMWLVLIIAATGGVGFFAFMMSLAHGRIRRKQKTLAVLRLLGFTQGSLLLFPLMQSLLTCIFGALFAGGLYAGVAYAVDELFAKRIGSVTICHIPPEHFLYAFGMLAALTIVATTQAALKASHIEPSDVIREI